MAPDSRTPLHIVLYRIGIILQNRTKTPCPLNRNRTIPTEQMPRPAKLVPAFRLEGVVWSAQRFPTAVNLSFLDRSRYFFMQVAGNRTRDLWVSSQELKSKIRGL
jgi:hypothetical protein